MLKHLFFWAAVLWTSIVFALCLIQSDNLPVVTIVNFDKYIHAFFHFVFTILWFLFLKSQLDRKSIINALFISFSLSVFYGIAIEVLQGILTATRKEDALDVVANMTGATLAVVTIIFFHKAQIFTKKIN